MYNFCLLALVATEIVDDSLISPLITISGALTHIRRLLLLDIFSVGLVCGQWDHFLTCVDSDVQPFF